MSIIYNNVLARWFFKKYFNIEKEVFKVEKNAIHYWLDKEKNEAQCRCYQFKIADHKIIRNLKRLILLPFLFVKMPFAFLVGLATDDTATLNCDNAITEINPYTSYRGINIAVLSCGYNSVTGAIWRILVDFTLPAGSGTISAVDFKAYVLTSNGEVVEAHLLTTAFDNYASWNRPKGAGDWVTPGGDFNAAVIDNVTLGASSGWYDWTLMGIGSMNPLTLTWGSNFQLIFKRDAESDTTKTCGFYSVSGTYPYYVEVTYTPAPPASASILLFFK